MKRRIRQTRTWLQALGLCLASIAGTPFAHAQLTNCANMHLESKDYKVVLDEFAYASDPARENPALEALRARLQFTLNGQVDSIKSSAKRLGTNLRIPLVLVFCKGRKPSLNGDEFTDTLAEHLSDGRVLVEMWGTLDVRTPPGKPPLPLAWIGYVIPPVQHYASDEDTLSRHVTEYPKNGDAQSVEELGNFPELAAFTLVGLGTKASRAKQYDLAVWAFSSAELALHDAQVTGTNDFIDTLLVYVKHAACTTRASAHRDHAYEGPLTLVPAQTCTSSP
jgi:hypothetical protein